MENSDDETAKLEAVAPSDFESREKELLILAKQWMPRLPFSIADVLLIDEIGKEICGSGMDTNVVGRKKLLHAAADDEHPKIKQIIVRGLSPKSHGNAAGIGLAEFCRSRVIRDMDFYATRTNCLTGGRAVGAMLPLDYETDQETLEHAFQGIGLTEPHEARVLSIRNTLHLRELDCSAAYYAEARERSDLEILTEPAPLSFDDNGNLPDHLVDYAIV